MKDYTGNRGKEGASVKENKSEGDLRIWVLTFVLIVFIISNIVVFFIASWYIIIVYFTVTMFVLGAVVNVSGVLDEEIEEEKSKEQMIEEIKKKTGIDVGALRKETEEEEKKMGYEEENDSEDTEEEDDDYDWNDEETIEKSIEGRINWLKKKGLPATYLTITSTEGVFGDKRYIEILNILDKNGYSYIGGIKGTDILIFKLKGAN